MILDDPPERAPVILRLATLDDAEFLRRLRNDPGTRQASRKTDEVSADEHRRWLAARLEDPHPSLFVAETAPGRAVGSGRLDVDGDRAELSLTIAPECRGLGFGFALVTALTRMAERLGYRPIAYVQGDNVVSLRAFLTAGYVARHPVRLEKPCASA